MTPVFLATVEHHKLKLRDPQAFGLWLGQFVGKEAEVIVRKIKRKRTTGQDDERGNQNGYYWAVVLPISASHLGYSIDEMHEVFTEEYAPYKTLEHKGKKVKIKVRTSEMNRVQFNDFLESIKQEMAEQGTFIPDPEKVV